MVFLSVFNSCAPGEGLASRFVEERSARYDTLASQKTQLVSRSSLPECRSGIENERRHSGQVTTKYPRSFFGIHTGAVSGFAEVRIGPFFSSSAICLKSSSGL